MACDNIQLRIVRGNAFKLRLEVEARRGDGTVIDGFTLSGDETLKQLKNGTATALTFVPDGNAAIISFDDDLDLGTYGLEMTGTYQDEPWRWCVTAVFQIVETNARANIPAWTFFADDTYTMTGTVSLLSTMVQADWDENDPADPGYIRNKPDLNEYATNVDLIATNQRVSTLEGNTVKTVAQSLNNLQKTTARNNISAASVAQVNAKQDTISDLSTIRSGAADGTVARGYLQDFSTRTHTPAEQVGQVLATVATQANGAQPRLTAGDNITITEENVISATGGGGSSDAVLYTPQTLTTDQQTQARTNISAYTKPSGGIPYNDLSSGVKQSLTYAETAVQSVVVDYQDEGVPVVVINVDGDETTIISGQQPSGPEYNVAPSWAGAERTFEQLTNKVTSVSSSSTNTQYPTAKCLYDLVGDVATLLAAI